MSQFYSKKRNMPMMKKDMKKDMGKVVKTKRNK